LPAGDALKVSVTADHAALPSTGRPGPRDYAAASKSANTWRAYRSDWQQWSAWCAAQGLDPWQVGPEHVAAWVSELAASYRPSSIGRKVAAVASVFKMAGRRPPTRDDRVRVVLAGIRRAHAGPAKQAAPLTGDLLRQVVADLDQERVADVRDGALLLLGFAAALRRSELVALDVEDLAFVAGGVKVTVRRSKVDQEGHGAVVGVPNGERSDTCPVRWVQRWLATSGVEGGPVWRMVDAHGHVRDGRMAATTVGLVVKRHCERSGLDPVRFSAHSLRSGLATSAASGGAQVLRLADHGRWRSLATVRGYVRAGAALDDGNPVRRAGL
jgi:site-specific recombinase XerD